MRDQCIEFSLLAVLALSPRAWADAEPITANTGRNCESPLVSAFVVEDPGGTPAWVADRMRSYRLAAPAALLRQELAATGCFTLLDHDPALANLPNLPQPDILLRARVSAMTANEKSLGEKAGSAVGRYLGSYFGGADEEILPLKVIELSIDVVCVRQRRMVYQLAVKAEAESVDASSNALTLAQAGARAATEVVEFMRRKPSSCEPRN